MICAAILAGGTGSRMKNGPLPKQFIEIHGKPLLLYTVEAFLDCAAVEHVVVAVTQGWLDYAEDRLKPVMGEGERVSVTLGGSDRLGSLVNACAYLTDRFGVNDDDLLLTHDGARPFVTQAVIEENLRLMAQYDCVTTAVPTIDTILCSEDGINVDDIPPRKRMYAVQTPQTFRTAELLAALEQLSEAEKNVLTDGAKIYLTQGKSVGIAMGASENIKITEPKDLLFAESFLKK